MDVTHSYAYRFVCVIVVNLTVGLGQTSVRDLNYFVFIYEGENESHEQNYI